MSLSRLSLLPCLFALTLSGCAGLSSSAPGALGAEAAQALDLAHTLRDNGRLEAAYEVYARMDERAQLREAYLLEYASVAAAVRPAQEALAFYQRAAQALATEDLAPAERVALCNGSARARLALGQASEAAKDFRCALQANPQNVQALNGLGVALNLQRQDEQAREQFAQALRIDPGYGPATNNLALSWLASGDTTKAIGLLNQSRGQQDVSLKLNLALAYVIAGQDDTALQVLQDNLDAQSAGRILEDFRGARQRIAAGAPLTSELLAASQQPLALKAQE